MDRRPLSPPQHNAAERLEHVYRFAEIGQIYATLIHELSGPLAAALIHLANPESDPRSIQQAHHSLSMMQKYLNTARDAIRNDNQTVWFRIKPIAEEVLRLWQPLAKQDMIRMRLFVAQDGWVNGDPHACKQIISNIVKNALDVCRETLAEPTLKSITITVEMRSQNCEISVSDNGPGIEHSQQGKVFEPFYSTKREGLGLGLHIVKQHVERFGGSIELTTVAAHGSTFKVRLPARLTRPKPSSAAARANVRSRRDDRLAKPLEPVGL